MILGFLHYLALLVIGIVFWYCLKSNKSAGKPNPSFPSLLITIGIAFTFLGVALGLQNFDVDKPTEGLETLINGIKTAFWGSFAGVIGAIALKTHSLFKLKEQDTDKQYENQVQKFYDEHTRIAENSDQLTQVSTENNNKLINAIEQFGLSLDEKNQKNTQQLLNSVVSSLDGIEHIQRSTQSVIAGEIQELKAEFINFAEQQAQQNTEIFIQALEMAIQRFNENLTDSLGENFRHLNQSVDRLITWQDNYAEQVSQQTKNYQQVVNDMQKMQQEFQNLLQHTSHFADITQNLEKALDAIDNKNTQFQNRIESFYGGLDAKIVEIEESRQLLEKGLDAVHQQMQSTQKSAEDIFKGIEDYIAKSHQVSLENQRSTNEEVQKLTKKMQQSFEQTQQQLQQGLTTIETKLAQTLNQSLMSLGQQLGSLSTKFAQDYEPITVNLKNMIDSLDQVVR